MDYPVSQMVEAQTFSLYETLLQIGPLFTIITLTLYIFILIKKEKYVSK